MSEKACSECGIVKPFDAFSRDRHHFTGHKSACKACANKRFGIWRAKNLEKVRRTDRVKHYVRKYGISEELAEKLADDANGSCEICGVETKLVVDHCHKKGVVRGLICGHCNSALGYARENPNILLAIIDYIKRHSHV